MNSQPGATRPRHRQPVIFAALGLTSRMNLKPSSKHPNLIAGINIEPRNQSTHNSFSFSVLTMSQCVHSYLLILCAVTFCSSTGNWLRKCLNFAAQDSNLVTYGSTDKHKQRRFTTCCTSTCRAQPAIGFAWVLGCWHLQATNRRVDVPREKYKKGKERRCLQVFAGIPTRPQSICQGRDPSNGMPKHETVGGSHGEIQRKQIFPHESREVPGEHSTRILTHSAKVRCES